MVLRLPGGPLPVGAGRAQCERLFIRLREVGLLQPDTDLDWARRVYYALIHEAAAEAPETDAAVDVLATRVVDTLLHGIGTPTTH
ncbi:hypothetical protein ACF08E_25060 [Streptomyces globisporus]|uniref:hypothetical protein n=1 Tax=Streptomyces globisporus TaxID=1908 RepID=UPI0036FA7DDC